MANRDSHKTRQAKGRDAAAGARWPPSDTARAFCLAGFTALVVATPLVPSESAAEFGTDTVLIMLWLLLLIAWLAAGFLFGESRFRFGWVDAAVGVFLVLHTASALAAVSAGRGDARATINALWQWIALGVSFFLARQLLRSSRAMRAVCAVLVSLAVALAAYGYYQYSVSMPRLRLEYAHHPEQVLREAGIALAPGSPERKLFEDRLNSTEPFATFALANSFAGFLAPWLMVALGIGVVSWGEERMQWRVAVASGACCLAIGLSVVMTKSRTALLAIVFGMMMLVLLRWRRTRRFDWRVPAAGAAVLGAVLAGAAALGALDRLVLSETPKSVLYRLQYWRSTLAMIADHPWLGCGPGNFRYYYTAYKLPEASETIADPHNFLLEVWATAGTPAAVAFVAILVLFAWRLRREPARHRLLGEVDPDGRSGRRRNGAAQDGPWDAAEGKGSTIWWVYGGAVAGMLLALPCSKIAGFAVDGAVFWLGLPAGAAGAVLLDPWSREGRLPVWLPAVALAVLLVNLSAAGGIGFAGVSQSGWLLLAVALNLLESERTWHVPRRSVAIALLGAACLIAVVFHQTAYLPVLRCRMHMDAAQAFLAAGQLDQAEAAYRAAAAADPYAAEPWLGLASLQLGSRIATGPDHGLHKFDAAVEEALRRNRRSHSVFQQVGDWRLALYRATGDRDQLRRAIEAYSASARLYPNSSMVHARLAWASYLAADRARAQREAQRALELDRMNPHRERKLARQQVFDPAGAPLGCSNAEQLMERLRRKA